MGGWVGEDDVPKHADREDGEEVFQVNHPPHKGLHLSLNGLEGLLAEDGEVGLK